MNSISRFIYGAGGHGRVVLDVARSVGVAIDYFVDDGLISERVENIPVISASEFERYDGYEFIVGIGMNATRSTIFQALLNKGCPLTVRHPFTWISPTVLLGRGTVLMAGVVVNTGAKIGDNVILNTSCSIDHDCAISSHVHICPGVNLAGGVQVGAGTMIGTGASVIPGITIGENCVIGAGSVVVKDIPPDSKAFGNPARVIGRNEPFDFDSARA